MHGVRLQLDRLRRGLRRRRRVPLLGEPLRREAQVIGARQQGRQAVGTVLGGGRRGSELRLAVGRDTVRLDGDAGEPFPGRLGGHLPRRRRGDRRQRDLLHAARVEVGGDGLGGCRAGAEQVDPVEEDECPQGDDGGEDGRRQHAARNARALVERGDLAELDPSRLRGHRDRAGDRLTEPRTPPADVDLGDALATGIDAECERHRGAVEDPRVVDRAHREVGRHVPAVGDDGGEAGHLAAVDDARPQAQRGVLDGLDLQPQVVRAVSRAVDGRLDVDHHEVLAGDRGRREAHLDRQHPGRFREQAEHGHRQVDPARIDPFDPRRDPIDDLGRVGDLDVDRGHVAGGDGHVGVAQLRPHPQTTSTPPSTGTITVRGGAVSITISSPARARITNRPAALTVVAPAVRSPRRRRQPRRPPRRRPGEPRTARAHRHRSP